MVGFLRTLIAAKRPEPSYPRLPEVGEDGRTNVAGIYAVGEVAGTPVVPQTQCDGALISKHTRVRAHCFPRTCFSRVFV